MRMMGSNGHDKLQIPTASFKNATMTSSVTPSRFQQAHHFSNMLSVNHHLGYESEQGGTRKEMSGRQPLRWSPTPEQLLTLEELYRRGTKTPTAQQIQQITAQLRRFGKVEGKNVFYWFQNHKARERQKLGCRFSYRSNERRRRGQFDGKISQINNEIKESSAGSRRTGHEVEKTKKWTLSNCIEVPQESCSMHRAAFSETANSSIQFDQLLRHRESTEEEKQASKQPIEKSYSLPADLIASTKPTTSVTLNKQVLHSQYFSKSLKLNTGNFNSFIRSNAHRSETQTATLELFPLESNIGTTIDGPITAPKTTITCTSVILDTKVNMEMQDFGKLSIPRTGNFTNPIGNYDNENTEIQTLELFPLGSNGSLKDDQHS